MFGKRKMAGRPVEKERESEAERRDPPSERTAAKGGLTLRVVVTPKDRPRTGDES